MLSNLNYLLVISICFVSICTAIRVHWNTNTGPIVPPTPTTTVKPVPPFREPAPVWEDLSNDIPDPNPYIYIPPPPSRPKQRLNTNVNYGSNNGGGKPYGIILAPHNPHTYQQKTINNNISTQVASLSPQYVPNVGTRYVAVVPTSIATTSTLALNKYAQASAPNSLSPDDKTSYKVQGKYNVKTKKYKAYEKVKHLPLNYYSAPKKSLANTAPATQSPFQRDQLFGQVTSPAAYNATTVLPSSNYSANKSYVKHVYAKNKTTLKSTQNTNEFVFHAKKS